MTVWLKVLFLMCPNKNIKLQLRWLSQITCYVKEYLKNGWTNKTRGQPLEGIHLECATFYTKAIIFKRYIELSFFK